MIYFMDNGRLVEIEVYEESGSVDKNKENRNEIKSITREAQLQCGHASINVKYYALKRNRKKLEENLQQEVLCVCDVKEKGQRKENSSNSSSRFHSAINILITAVIIITCIENETLDSLSVGCGV